LIREIYNFYYPNIYFNFADVVKFLNLKYKKNKSNNFIYIKKAKKNIMGENMLLSKNHNMILILKYIILKKKIKKRLKRKLKKPPKKLPPKLPKKQLKKLLKNLKEYRFLKILIQQLSI
jgi:hypothetical protein